MLPLCHANITKHFFPVVYPYILVKSVKTVLPGVFEGLTVDEVVDALGSFTTACTGCYQRTRTCLAIPGGKKFGPGCLLGDIIHNKGLPGCCLYPFRSLQEGQVHALADGRHNRITIERKFRSLDGNRPPPTAFVGSSQFHANAFESNHASIFGNNAHRCGQKVECHILFFGVPDFHLISRHLMAGSAVDKVHILLLDPERTSHTVNRDIPTADHNHTTPLRIGVPSFVDIQEILYTGYKPFVAFVFSLDPHGCAVLCSDTDKDRIKIVFQL